MTRLIDISSDLFAPVCAVFFLLKVTSCDSGNAPGNASFNSVAEVRAQRNGTLYFSGSAGIAATWSMKISDQKY
jgi:hypothetical protein